MPSIDLSLASMLAEAQTKAEGSRVAAACVEQALHALRPALAAPGLSHLEGRAIAHLVERLADELVVLRRSEELSRYTAERLEAVARRRVA